MIRCIILDDDANYRDLLEHYVKQYAQAELVLAASSSQAVKDYLAEQGSDRVDLLISDINMPEQNGLDFYATMAQKPEVIFITHYPEYAVNGFDLSAIDYLVKPFSYNRFQVAMQKVEAKLALQKGHLPGVGLMEDKHELDLEEDFFFIRSDSQYIKIQFEDVHYIEAMRDFVKIVTGSNTYVSLLNLKNLEDRLPANLFARTHRSYIVNVRQVEAISSNEVKLKTCNVPLGATYKDTIFENVVKDRLFTKLV